jgi:aminoglycoside phosphotransferase (APT) family kinase protein
MDVNQRIELIHEVESTLWVEKVNQTRQKLLPEWISTFHPDRLCCQIEGGFLHGAYNVGQKVTFSDCTAWMIRFPRVGNICGQYADKKVAMEVEVMSLIREKTTIPVPQIKAWGLAASNPLGLGPFIIMDFIEGVSLNTLLKDPNAKLDTRLIREDINDSDIEFIYRQFANFLLQLFKLDFDRIGSLPSPQTGFPVPIRPLTFKVHDITQTGGVDTFGMA